MSASSGVDVASLMTNSELQKQLEFTTSFEKASERMDISHVFNLTGAIRGFNPGEVGEDSVAREYFDRQSHTHHNYQNAFSLCHEI